MSDRLLKIFILEDSSERIEWFKKTFSDCKLTITDDAVRACHLTENNDYDLIFLDRDLGEGRLEGEHLTDYMSQKNLAKDATIVIHSTNIIVREKMKKSLEIYHKDVYQIDYTQLRKMKREDFIK